MTPRRWLQGILGIFLLVFGVLWVLQGLNIVGGSFMTGQTIWLIIGIIVALLGVWLLWTLRSGTGKADVG
jgi:multisubunit Na+/H+ antiporter MnhB subunit